MTNDQIALVVKSVAEALLEDLPTAGPEKEAALGIVVLATNLLQNINTIATSGKNHG